MKKVILWLAPAVLIASGVQEFEANGVAGSTQEVAGKLIVTAKASSCNTEAISVRVRFRREGQTEGFRLVTKAEPVVRCSAEAVSFVLDRAADEHAILVAFQELAVINNAAAPRAE